MPGPEILLKQPDFLVRRREWKGHPLAVHISNAGQVSYPSDGVSLISRSSPPQPPGPNVNFVSGAYIGLPRSYPVGPNCLQDSLMYQPSLGSSATSFGPQPFNNQLPTILQHNTPTSYGLALPRSYPYAALLSDSGRSGAVSNIDATSIANSCTFDSRPPTPVYLTEPRGVHIGNIPFETSEAEIKRLVAQSLQIRDDQILDVKLPINAFGKQKGYALVSFETRAMAEYAIGLLDGIMFRKNRLKVKTDQDWQTLYPVQSSTANYPGNDPSYHYQPQHGQAASHQQRSPSYPVTSAVYENNDPEEYVEQTPSANPEPETAVPAVVDGSKHRMRS